MQWFHLKLKNEKEAFLEFLKNRGLNLSGLDKKVQKIVQKVQSKGDEALYEFTEQFDKVKLAKLGLEVSPAEMEKAYKSISPKFKEALDFAKSNILQFHSQAKRFSWEMSFVPGSRVGEIFNPLDSVGIYIPGGTAPLVSTILMTALPAKIAGVSQVIALTPPGAKGKIPQEMLAAFYAVEVNRVFRVGGAQAIAALAYGTETIPKVDKIVGPGNQFVTAAKKLVYGDVGIDTLAGPSEVLILADKSAKPAYVAADMLSQLEHDPESVAVLVSKEREVLKKTQSELEKQVKKLKRQKQLKTSCDKGAIFVEVGSWDEAISITNQFAPEHCELAVKEPETFASQIRSAGALFLGNYSPVATGDFVAGPSHVLPTNGAGRFSSGLSLDDFMRKTSLIYYNKEALSNAHEILKEFTRVEGLDAHQHSVNIRFEK